MKSTENSTEKLIVADLRIDSKLIRGQFEGINRDQGVTLLLHGYSQSARSFVHTLAGSKLIEEPGWLCVQAPFPVPVATKAVVLLGYSWYFYDVNRKQFLVPMSVAIEYLRNVLRAEGVLGQLTRIIGYSQGGILAPFVAQALKSEAPRLEQVVIIGGRIRSEDLFQKPVDFQIDSIHGDLDDQVDYKLSLEQFELAKGKGLKGQFVTVFGGRHELNHEMINKIPKK